MDPVTVRVIALRAQPVTEVGSRVISYIALQSHPLTIGPLNLLALHTRLHVRSAVTGAPVLIPAPSNAGAVESGMGVIRPSAIMNHVSWLIPKYWAPQEMNGQFRERTSRPFNALHAGAQGMPKWNDGPPA